MLIESYPTVGIRANHGLEFKAYESEYVYFLGFLQIGHSVQFRSFSTTPKLNIFTYLESTQRDDQIGGWPIAGGGRTRPHAPSRAATRTEDDGA